MATAKKSNKKTVNFESLTDEQLLNLDLDKINLNELLEKNTALKQKLAVSKGKKEPMYKIDVDKNSRRKIRKIRNKHISNVISFYQSDNKTELKKEIDSFNKFYKETYTKNDYSLESICRLNSDKSTLSQAKIFLHIIKETK